MPTIQQLVRNGREQISNTRTNQQQDRFCGLEVLPAKAWRLHPCVHQHPEEAELCSS